MRKFFTADWHFNHNAIIKYCNRPFNNVPHMNSNLIYNINKTLSKEDILYVLGDVGWFRWTGLNRLKSIMHKIKGTKILILGNHDEFTPFQYVDAGFQSVHTSLEINEGFTLVHDPALSCIDRSKWFLCGHSHDLFKMQLNCINVGVDVWDYKPVSMEQIDTLITVNELGL